MGLDLLIGFIWAIFIIIISPSPFWYVFFSILSVIILGSFNIFLALIPWMSIFFSFSLYYQIHKKYKEYVDQFNMGYFPNEEKISRNRFFKDYFKNEKSSLLNSLPFHKKEKNISTVSSPKPTPVIKKIKQKPTFVTIDESVTIRHNILITLKEQDNDHHKYRWYIRYSSLVSRFLSNPEYYEILKGSDLQLLIKEFIALSDWLYNAYEITYLREFDKLHRQIRRYDIDIEDLQADIDELMIPSSPQIKVTNSHTLIEQKKKKIEEIEKIKNELLIKASFLDFYDKDRLNRNSK